jgi:uncharacterized protein with PIN domain
MIKLVKSKKPVEKYSATCLSCKAEFTFDKSDTRTITDEEQGRSFDVVSCPECKKNVSQWFWTKIDQQATLGEISKPFLVRSTSHSQ